MALWEAYENECDEEGCEPGDDGYCLVCGEWCGDDDWVEDDEDNGVLWA